MDAYLAVVSKREVRQYTDQPLSDEQLERLLQAGRAAGSAANRQPWLFVLVTDREHLESLAGAVYEPDNVRGCAAAIAVVIRSAARSFDAGRAAQNMMLAAWNDGVGTCPNGIQDSAIATEVLGISEDQHIATIISLGYPLKPTSPEGRDPDQILERIKRKPLSEIVRRL